MIHCTFTNDDNCSILLPEHEFSEPFNRRDNHEIFFRKINTFLIKKGVIKNNIIDSGAWIGDNAIPWAKNIDGIVYAIDPSIENCDFINEVCKLNNISNVKTVKFALCETNKVLTTVHNLQHCSFVWGNIDGVKTNETEAVSLDFLYEKNVIENVGYIHLDVEGMELIVLLGSDNLINQYRPLISFEQHLELEDYTNLEQFFFNKNYKVYLIDEILPGCRHDARNLFAFPVEGITENLINEINEYIGSKILIEK